MTKKEELLEKVQKSVHSNNFDDARKHAYEACSLFPDDAECHYFLAEIYRLEASKSPLIGSSLCKISLTEFKKVWDLDISLGISSISRIIEVLRCIAMSEDDDRVIMILEQIRTNTYYGDKTQTIKMLMEKYC